MEKFQGVEADKTVAVQDIEVVDLSSDDHTTPVIKRPCPFVNDIQLGNFKMLEEIKKEKE